MLWQVLVLTLTPHSNTLCCRSWYVQQHTVFLPVLAFDAIHKMQCLLGLVRLGAECYDILFACSTLCDPYLNLFRGIIPPLNGTIDLSPILAFIALDVGVPSCLCCLPGCRAWRVAQDVSSCTFSNLLQCDPWLPSISWHSC